MNQQELQQKMQKLKPDYQVRLNQEQQEISDKEIFTGTIPVKMATFRQFVFMHMNEIALNISVKYWKSCFHGNNETYCLTDITTFLTAAQGRTFREWLNTIPYAAENAQNAIADWVEFRVSIETMENELNPILEAHFNTLWDKMMKIQHLDMSGQTHAIPTHKKMLPAHR